MDNYALLIDAHGFSAWRHAGQSFECVLRQNAAEGNNGEAVAKLQSWLTLARGRCTPIADFADERHMLERLPRASRADRRLLIQRRLEQRFPESALTSAAVLSFSPEDGLLTPVRLAALSRPALAVPWLNVLGEAAARGRVELRALTSVLFLFERWYRRQRDLPEQALILAPGAGGLRQLFFRRRRLVFSRTIPASAASLVDCLPTYREELAQTLVWLTSQRLCDKPPPVRVLAAADDFSLLRELAPFAGGDFDCIALAAHPGADGCADIRALSLRETRRRGELGHYEHPGLVHPRRLVAIRRAMSAATLTFSAVALADAASNFATTETLEAETARFAARQQVLQTELGQFSSQSTKSPAGLSVWLDEAERFAHAPGIASADVLQATADLLAEAPWARLESLGWHMAQDEARNEAQKQTEAQNGGKPSVQSDATVTPSAAIELEISLGSNAPSPNAAADALSARWRRLHGTVMRANIEGGLARLRLNAALSLASHSLLSPPEETQGKSAP